MNFKFLTVSCAAQEFSADDKKEHKFRKICWHINVWTLHSVLATLLITCYIVELFLVDGFSINDELYKNIHTFLSMMINTYNSNVTNTFLI